MLDLPQRPRRNRRTAVMRGFARETFLLPQHFIYPLFIHEHRHDVPIVSMPGCARLSPDSLLREVEGAVRERYLARRVIADALPVPPVEDLAEKILRGEATLESVKSALDERDPHYDVYLEDHITQVGQGLIVDRDLEILGIADVGVKLIRELWNDALEELANGRKPLVWSHPPEVVIKSGDKAEAVA